MHFSIIIPTYNRDKDLFSCLESLGHYFELDALMGLGFKTEVIVSDDGRDPDLRTRLAFSFPWCTYTEGPARGPAANRNHGAKKACGEWLVFTDDDCLPQVGLLEAYFEFSDNSDVLEGKTSPCGIKTRADEECPVNIDGGCLWSCNFAIKRTLFLSLCGFNEDFPAPAMEDVEFFARIKKCGLNCKFVPNALVLHPWRYRKGYEFTFIHAKCVAKFVNLHPEYVTRFSLLSQITSILRIVKIDLIRSISSGLYRGLPRAVFLDTLSIILTWYYVRKVKNKLLFSPF
jgi:GT2 family glycosyltransferase